MNKTNIAILTCVVSTMAVLAAEKTAGGTAIPSHPSKLSYSALDWDIPLGSQYREKLKNGLRAYVAADSSLPLVQISAYIRGGTLLDPRGKEGMTSLMVRLMRIGGTENYQPDSLDALLDLYAMKFTVSASEGALQFTASFLSDYIDTAFTIIRQMLFHPRFDDKKLGKEKKIFIETIRHRFDNPGPTLDIAYRKSLYPGTPASGLSTERSIERISRSDLVDLHRRLFSTGAIIVSIAGKFDRSAMIDRLEASFPSSGKRSDTAFTSIAISPAQKCLVVHKPISQAYVRFGAPLFKRPDADYYAVSVANMILGGGGFTSRLGTKVRSDAGLTYSIYSSAESNYSYPATWYVEFFTKNESFPRATALALQVIDNVRAHGVTPGELENAKASLIGEIPSMFRSPFDIVSTYAWNEYYGRSPTIFKEYPDSIRAITKDDVTRVAKKYLDPSSLTYTVVGDTAALAAYRSAEGFDLQKLQPCKTVTADSISFLP